MGKVDLDSIIQQWQGGDKQAETMLYQYTYLELRRLAKAERERSAKNHGSDNQVLLDSVNSTTALIHDAYLKISQCDAYHIEDQRDFYLMAANVMRQILIDNARKNQASKRQQDQQTLSEQENTDKDDFEQYIVLDQMLDTFTEKYPRQSHAVRLKYFMGMKTEEISELLACSTSLVEKDLKFSRAWLASKM